MPVLVFVSEDQLLHAWSVSVITAFAISVHDRTLQHKKSSYFSILIVNRLSISIKKDKKIKLIKK